MEDRLALRPVREDDLALLERLTNDPECTGPYEWHGWMDPSAWRHRWSENGLLGSAGGTLIVARGADALGFVNWRQIFYGTVPTWEIGIGMLPGERGRGVGTRAHVLISRYLFAHTTANRIQAVTESGNRAEQRALEKAGFTREGVLRQAGFRDGCWRDAVLYSLLREDPSGPGEAGAAGDGGTG